jgi:hypothetical protein
MGLIGNSSCDWSDIRMFIYEMDSITQDVSWKRKVQRIYEVKLSSRVCGQLVGFWLLELSAEETAVGCCG